MRPSKCDEIGGAQRNLPGRLDNFRAEHSMRASDLGVKYDNICISPDAKMCFYFLSFLALSDKHMYFGRPCTSVSVSCIL